MREWRRGRRCCGPWQKSAETMTGRTRLSRWIPERVLPYRVGGLLRSFLRGGLDSRSASSADNATSLPSRQTWSGNPRRACSAITSSTASMNAISARFSSGKRRTDLEALFICHRVVRSAFCSSQGLIYGAFGFSRQQLGLVSCPNCQTNTKNPPVGDTPEGSFEWTG